MKHSRDTRSTLAQSLRRHRLAADMTQAQVAEKLGLQRDTYVNYEVDRAHPGETVIQRLSVLYNVDPADLTGESGEPLTLSDAAAEAPRKLSENEKSLIKLFRLMEPAAQEALLQMLLHSTGK